MTTNHAIGETRKEIVSQGGGGGVQPLPAPAANESTIKEFIPESWFHPVGIFKVLARLWDRLPDVGGKLFLTFTLDPKQYADEETAFEDSRDWLRKVFYKLRHGIEYQGKIREGSCGRGAGCKYDTTSLAWGECSPDWQPAWPSNQQAG